MKDDLGDRMKDYEVRTKMFLPRRTYAIIRLDGRAFHTFTKGLKRPFDEDFASDMDETAKYLCENIQGAQFAYVQSDEISILITDFKKITSSAWFDNQIQKMASISASMASAMFNYLRLQRYFCGDDFNIARENDNTIGEHFKPGTNLEDVRDNIASFINYMPLKPKFAAFDARVFSIADPFEVHNCFVWRQKDATRNSISMAAQSMCSHKELQGKSSNEMQDMMHEKGVNWNDYPVRFKRGGFICKEKYISGVIGGEDVPENFKIGPTERSRWVVVDPPIFTKEKEFTFIRIPVIAGENTMSLLDIANISA